MAMQEQKQLIAQLEEDLRSVNALSSMFRGDAEVIIQFELLSIKKENAIYLNLQQKKIVTKINLRIPKILNSSPTLVNNTIAGDCLFLKVKLMCNLSGRSGSFTERRTCSRSG